jgi:hypothetical protein
MSTIDHEEWARTILAYLVKYLQSFQGGNKYITYGELAKKIDYPEPHIGNLFGSNIGKTLGVMGHLFDNFVVDGQNVPLIQALVVGQANKLPSDGLKEFDTTYPNLSNEKKRDFVYAEYEKIFDFGSRWEQVLEKLKIKPYDNIELPDVKKKQGLYNPYGGEGSPEHVALRDFIANNPSVIGLNTDKKGVTEYPLKSGDKIDVVFELENEIIGVEVKSRRSGIDDLERGLFQCVKYAAVLEAEKKLGGRNTSIRCMLVIEDSLTNQLSRTQKILNVDVRQNINVI